MKKMTGSVFPASIVASEGESAQIDCVVEGNSNVPVSWFKNNLILGEVPSKLEVMMRIFKFQILYSCIAKFFNSFLAAEQWNFDFVQSRT